MTSCIKIKLSVSQEFHLGGNQGINNSEYDQIFAHLPKDCSELLSNLEVHSQDVPDPVLQCPGPS